jgi:two-component system sensor histidine kinase VicK
MPVPATGDVHVLGDRLLAAIVESSDDAIITKTLDGIITSWNPAAERLYGYTESEALGREVSIIIPRDRPDELPSIMNRLRHGERIDHFETVRVRKDGARLDISVSISPIYDDLGGIIGAASIGRDITEKLRSERERKALQQQADQELAARTASEERFRAVWDATSEALALSDADGVVLDVNPAYCALYGRSAEEFIGHNFAIIFGADDQATAATLYQAVFSSPEPPQSYEARISRPDGSERVVEARADFLVRDGQRVAMVSAIRDITERKRLDQAQLDFVAMASHDLASPLTVLRARAQLLQRRQRYEEESVKAILDQTSRMGRLISDLRELVQVEGGGLSLQIQPIDLGELAQAAVDQALTLTTTHKVRFEGADCRVMVQGDRDRLGQVLDNLIGNAIKYSSPEGEIVVRTEAVDGEAHVSVSDQGAGIPADILPSLFDRFYRGGNSSGEAGLGLGLYITRMLLEAHGGRIWATSEEGVGSTFTAALPLATCTGNESL